MTTPVIDAGEIEVGQPTDGELPIRLPVVVIEGLDTSDGRYISAGALTPRGLPLSLLAQPGAAHGGDEPAAAVVVGRIDTLERRPGPEVVSRRTGQPFPEGTFVWVGEGAIGTDVEIDGRNVADMVRRRFLRGVSVDLVGVDYDVVGDEGFAPDPEHPRREIITNGAEIAAATLVPIPAFGDCYVELADEPVVPEPITPEELPEGLMASAVPAWRSSELGDECGLCLAGLVAAAGEHTGGMIALVPAPADAERLAVEGGEPIEELHLTLAYLGEDVTGWDDGLRGEAIEAAEKAVATLAGPIEARAFAHTTFNADGGPDGDRDPCAVYGIGDSDQLVPLRDAVLANLRVSEIELPAQHEPFVPHVTAGYGLTASDLSYLGPVTFDRVRVALGSQTLDIPLDDPVVAAAPPSAGKRRKAADDGDTYPGTDKFPIDTRERAKSAVRLHGSSDIPAEKVKAWLKRRLKAKGWEDLVPDEWTKDGAADHAPAALADDPGALPDELEEETGLPDAPQPCQYGDHPAVRSLLFDEGVRYVPVCDEHEQAARELLTDNGAEVVRAVTIRSDADDEAVVAAAGPRPPAAWFADPQFDGPTPLRVDEDGRVRGHAALWDSCHRSFPGQCITAPRSASGYAQFRVGAVLCDDGTEVAVGPITMDTGHAGTDLSRHAAVAHYDHTGTAVADVAVGEDAFGIWVAGAIRPGVDEVTAARLRASALSGDWRRVGGGLELCALLAVNVPGFVVPRARVASGMPQALVAAGALRPGEPRPSGAVVLDYDVLADALAVRLEERRAAGELSARQAQLLDELDDTAAVVAALLAEVDDTPDRAAALLAELDGQAMSDRGGELEELARLIADDDGSEAFKRHNIWNWLRHGEGAARIRWGTPGDWTRCYRMLFDEPGVGPESAKRLCAQAHRDTTGMWPGDRRNS